MFKGSSAQSVSLFAFDITTGAAKLGDAANQLYYITKDWGTPTLISGSTGVPTEMSSINAPGWYKIAISSAETNADAILVTGKSTAANVSVVGQLIYTLPPNFTTMSVSTFGTVLVTSGVGTGQISLTSGAVAASSVSGNVGGSVASVTAAVLISSGVGTGQLVLASGAVAASSVSGNVGGSVASVTAAVLVSSGTGTGQLLLSSGTVTATTTNAFPTNFSNMLVSTGGLVVASSVTGGIGGSVVGSVASVTAPVVASSVTGSVGGSVASVVAAVVASSVTGSVGGSVASVAAGGITATSFGSSAIDSSALAASAATEIADATLTRDWTAVTYTSSLRTLLTANQFLRNKWLTSGSTLVVYREDDTTVSWQSSITTSSAALPITGNDPT